MEDQATYQTARVNASDLVPGRRFVENGHGIEIHARFDLRGVSWVCFSPVNMALPSTVTAHELARRINAPTFYQPYLTR